MTAYKREHKLMAIPKGYPRPRSELEEANVDVQIQTLDIPWRRQCAKQMSSRYLRAHMD
jgi:hypothetical protein